MNVANILWHKERAGSGVISISADADCQALANLLFASGTDAALVMSANNELLGSVSERDIVGGLAAHGPQLYRMTVGALMCRSDVTVPSCESVESATRTMVLHNLRHIPVVDNGRPLGIIGINDLLLYHYLPLKEASTWFDADQPEHSVRAPSPSNVTSGPASD